MESLALSWERRQEELAKPDGLFMVSAHRGYWTSPEGYPENSLPAFAAAYEAGVDIVEVDVRKTADGALILSHDEKLIRTTNIEQAWKDGLLGDGEPVYTVGELTLAQIKALRRKSGEGGPDATVTDVTVPTLAEALQACRHKMYLLLDLGWGLRHDIYPLLAQYDAFDSCLFQMGGSLQETQREIEALEIEYGGRPLFNWFCCGKTTADASREAQALIGTTPRPSIVQPGIDCLGWLAVVDKTFDLEMAYSDELLSPLRGQARLMFGTYHDWGRRLGFEMDGPAVWRRLFEAGYRSVQTDHPFECLQFAHQVGLR